MVFMGTIAALVGGSAIVVTPGAAYADGPVACGPLTQPPFPDEGFCADYNGDNTWYGTYGPGFPTPEGYGLCGEPPASGGGFPVPSYDYILGGAPAGAGGDWNALGFALSQGLAAGWWGGRTGQFTAAQAAAAAKLLYDTVVWGTPTPSMDPGVLAAYDDFDNWFLQARGTAAGPPQMSAGLTSNSGSFTGWATDLVHLEFAGTASPMVGEGVLLSIANGTFNSPNGPTTAGLSTDANGNVLIPIYATNSAPVSVTIQSASAVGRPGLDFYHASVGNLSAQVLVGFSPSSVLTETQALVSVGSAPPAAAAGTVSVQKAGDDTAYFGLAGAVFDIQQGGSTVAALATDAAGATPVSGPLAVGTYIVHEQVPPVGYQVAPDQTVSVTANANAVVSFTGAEEDHITPASVTLHKVDAQSSGPLVGAVFDVAYSSGNNADFDQDLGTCTTGTDGSCAPAGNDGTMLRPGNYEIREIGAPPGYFLDPTTATQTVSLTPGESGSVTFADFELGSLTLRKSGDDTAYTPVEGAVFSVSGPSPSPAVIGVLTVDAAGQTNTISGLVPGTYTVTETTPPVGYQAVAPVSVAVADGTATTTVDVTDQVIAATVSLRKIDQETNAPLAGAVLDVAYDPDNAGSYPDDLGTCTTAASGDCVPTGNDGAALLPGNYRVTEVTPPPGYALDPAASTKTITLTPAEAGSVSFSDALLVPASFQKTASGNVNAAIMTLAGAQLAVHQDSATGAVVATCTTDATGSCTTAATLLSGGAYCWSEVAPPTGLSGGASGCFTADNAQAAAPIVVDDAGLFVGVAAKKVDAADPSVTLSGAVFDLYRKDGGQGPGTVPTPPADAATEAGETWMARMSTGDNGVTTFPLQFPGFAYCVVEEVAPANFEVNGVPQCTDVLDGSVTVPPVLTFLTFGDNRQTLTLSAHKFNSAVPDTSIAGASYDLYAEGAGPPSTTPPAAPTDAAVETGDTWFARGTSDASGNLTFTVPAGFAWCLLEHSAPPDYLPDDALHCSSTLTTSSPPTATTIALPETVATVYVSAHKYIALQPDTVIAGATYALLVQGALPAGQAPVSTPSGVTVPAGDAYFAQGTTDAQGLLSFAVPSGYAWCLQELVAPAQYQPDPTLHCSSVLTNETTAAAASLALPETPIPGPGPGPLAFTGGPGWWLPLGGMLLIVGGFGLLLMKRKMEGEVELLAGALVDGVDELAQAGEVPLVESEGQPG